MDDKGDIRDDLRVPADEELSRKMKEELEKGEGNVIITVLSAVGEEAIIACKNSTWILNTIHSWAGLWAAQ